MPEMSPEEQAFRNLPPGPEKNKAFQEWKKAAAQTPAEEPVAEEEKSEKPKPAAKKAGRRK